MRRIPTYIAILLLWVIPLTAQDFLQKGVPPLQNFSPSEYHNSGKVWDIDSASNGIVYFAAENGLLEYDGLTWNVRKGSDGFTRSVYVASDSLIYTGSDLDFGVWKRNQYFEFEYHSLYPFREELVELNEEFWDIHQKENSVLFVSASNIYVYGNENLTKISAPNRLNGSFSVGDSIYFSDEQSGLYVMQDLALTPVFEYPEEGAFEISGIYQHRGDLILATYNSGLYRFDGESLAPIPQELSRLLASANVFSFENIGPQKLAFGTVMNGLLITEFDGTIIQQINRNKGLSNNTILSLHSTANGVLWLGTDYGISSIDLRSNLSFIYDYQGEFGTGYSAHLYDNTFYLGTNRGLYVTNWTNLSNNRDSFDFNFIPDSDGQVWTLKEIGNDLFVGHDRGLFTLSGNNISRIGNNRGIWTLIPFREFILAGTYNGISVFEKNSENWEYLKQVDLITGSVNQLIPENDEVLWVNIPNYGFIRIGLDGSLYPNERTFFTTDLFDGKNPIIRKKNGNILVQTDLYTYSYSPADTSFQIKDEHFFETEPKNSLPEIYQPTLLDNQYSFIPVYNGFALKSPEIRDTSTVDSNSFQVLFRTTEAYNTDNRVPFSPGASIDPEFNNIQVDFLIPNQTDVYYQFRLNEDEWSEWATINSLNFIDLTSGEYVLTVRGLKNNRVSDDLSLSFYIAAPWYKSGFAYTFYFLFVAAFIYLTYLWQKKSLKKQKKKLMTINEMSLKKQSEKHKREIMKLEKDRLQSEFDELKQQLRNKTIELAKKAKENQDKNRLLNDLKIKIERILENPEIAKSSWKKIHSTLDSFINSEDNTFEIQMDELHQEFYQRLKKSFPELSVNDLRLCAYLKLGLNSKEVAEIMNIKPSSVYISRSRLRKKLGLDTNEDLHDFLNTY